MYPLYSPYLCHFNAYVSFSFKGRSLGKKGLARQAEVAVAPVVAAAPAAPAAGTDDDDDFDLFDLFDDGNLRFF